ncbi:heterokaryon incompatibility protein-domain-containing protein [Lophiotrema nucula]|uniref:Heterokaryon incompatibility protein-domain-containing protein n=1 Tax=Lophiotrema nucula TaxID=690887 RepID=A0A6A5YV62_9PLEO|nr:heterokaryon incompatibility protein-domain-containing protein [Lophiotrema nucula]
MDPFKYTVLPSENHIRIIELLPGAPEDVIRCNLTIELRHPAQKPYDAISYVWGEAEYDEIICCQRSMRITVNLADALRTIRTKSLGRTVRLWADAISINQHDTVEKNHQVKRMGKVYENASHVHIWLGPDEDGIAQDLFSLIQRWIRCLKEYKEPSDIPHTVAASDLCKDADRGSKLAKLMHRPWFSRVWVVQEVALSESAQLHWGNATLDFADLVELACFYDGSSNVISLIGGDNVALRLIRTLFQCVYRTYGKTGSWGTHRSGHFKRLSQHHPPHSGLFLDILSVGKILSASEARDHVYSFLGNPLALDGEGKMIVEPDYSKPEEQVNLELAAALLRRPSEYPYVLCFVQHSSAEAVTGSGVPSWVPRWRNDTMERKLTFTIGNIGLGSTAGGSPEKTRYRIQESHILVLQGLIIDQLCWTSDLLKTENFALDPGRWDESLRTLQHPYIDLLWEEVSLAFGRCLGPDMDLDRARYYDDFSSTLVTGYNTKKFISRKRHEHILRAYHQVFKSKRSVQPSVNSKYIVSKTKDTEAGLFERETRNCSGRRFGITKSGGFVLVPKFAEVGDVCAVVLGMATPFVLRPAEVQGGGHYYLVGEAYIHGAMRGEFEGDLDRDKTEIMLV